MYLFKFILDVDMPLNSSMYLFKDYLHLEEIQFVTYEIKVI